MTEQVETILSEWTAAERTGDTEKLAAIVTDDFYGVGPLGFVLPRRAWLDRHRQGLAYEAFDLADVQVHGYADVSIVTARNNTFGTYQGQPLPEAVRATLVIAADSGAQRLAAIHMSFIAGTPGNPPVPGGTTPPMSASRSESGQGSDSGHGNTGDGR